jgi:hypothetical protein
VDANGWSILTVAKLVEDTEAWDHVQLRSGLLVDTVSTYDGEDYSCKETSTAELIKMIDSPQRPLTISFRDPEFDTAEAKAAAEKCKAEQDTGSKGTQKVANRGLSEGESVTRNKIGLCSLVDVVPFDVLTGVIAQVWCLRACGSSML